MIRCLSFVGASIGVLRSGSNDVDWNVIPSNFTQLHPEQNYLRMRDGNIFELSSALRQDAVHLFQSLGATKTAPRIRLEDKKRYGWKGPSNRFTIYLAEGIGSTSAPICLAIA